MSDSAVVIVKQPETEELVEVPVDADGSLQVATLDSQFAGATGLKFKNPDTGAYRAIRVEDGKLLPPNPEEGWGTTVYEVVVSESSKRRADVNEQPSKRAARQEQGDEGEDAAEDGEERYDPRKSDRTNEPPGVASHPEGRPAGEITGPTGKTCYKCGGQGHIAVMCPSPEGAKDNPNDSVCHLCHGKGHFQARCPNTVPRNVCWKCGMYGHIGRECGMGYADPYAPHDPYGRPPYGGGYGGGGGGFDRACYVCGERGHLAARCPRSTYNGEKLCHVCRKPGHIARDCKLCRVCLGEGHRSYDCPHRGSQGGDYQARASPGQQGYGQDPYGYSASSYSYGQGMPGEYQ